MTSASTTIRVTTDQRERLRSLAEQRQSSMTDALDAALDSLKREQFYREMASAEAALRKDPKGWEQYLQERDNWLNADLGK
jgi:predicted transcriptional regulator